MVHDFLLLRILGKGAFGTVRLCRGPVSAMQDSIASPSSLRAVKILSRAQLRRKKEFGGARRGITGSPLPVSARTSPNQPATSAAPAAPAALASQPRPYEPYDVVPIPAFSGRPSTPQPVSATVSAPIMSIASSRSLNVMLNAVRNEPTAPAMRNSRPHQPAEVSNSVALVVTASSPALPLVSSEHHAPHPARPSSSGSSFDHHDAMRASDVPPRSVAPISLAEAHLIFDSLADSRTHLIDMHTFVVWLQQQAFAVPPIPFKRSPPCHDALVQPIGDAPGALAKFHSDSLNLAPTQSAWIAPTTPEVLVATELSPDPQHQQHGLPPRAPRLRAESVSPRHPTSTTSPTKAAPSEAPPPASAAPLVPLVPLMPRRRSDSLVTAATTVTLTSSPRAFGAVPFSPIITLNADRKPGMFRPSSLSVSSPRVVLDTHDLPLGSSALLRQSSAPGATVASPLPPPSGLMTRRGSDPGAPPLLSIHSPVAALSISTSLSPLARTEGDGGGSSGATPTNPTTPSGSQRRVLQRPGAINTAVARRVEDTVYTTQAPVGGIAGVAGIVGIAGTPRGLPSASADITSATMDAIKASNGAAVTAATDATSVAPPVVLPCTPTAAPRSPRLG